MFLLSELYDIRNHLIINTSNVDILCSEKRIEYRVRLIAYTRRRAIMYFFRLIQ